MGNILSELISDDIQMNDFYLSRTNVEDIRKNIPKYCSENEKTDSNPNFKDYYEYIHFWIGNQKFKELLELSDKFYDWNTHSFELLTTYLDLLRKKLISYKNHEYILSCEITDENVLYNLDNVIPYLDIFIDYDLQSTCPHKHIDEWEIVDNE
jgi:hypothetical protein